MLEHKKLKNDSFNSTRFAKEYTILESARPFSFLNGIHGKWCKLDFEHYGIHANKLAFCNTFAHVP